MKRLFWIGLIMVILGLVVFFAAIIQESPEFLMGSLVLMVTSGLIFVKNEDTFVDDYDDCRDHIDKNS